MGFKTTNDYLEASHGTVGGDNMKRLWIVALGVTMMGSLTNYGHTQTTPTPVVPMPVAPMPASPTPTPATPTKQDTKAQKDQAKADKKAQKDAQKAGKKTTTSQDAAYALAHKNQAPEGKTPQ